LPFGLVRFALAGLTAAGLGAPATTTAAAAGDTPPCQGTVFLTFDTGNMAQAELIARILAEEGVRATFFLANERTVRGDHALDDGWGGYWRARAAEGHVFGNHTWSHFYARRDLEDGRLLVVDAAGRERRLDQREFCAELSKVDEAFRRLTGQRLAGLWRAPGGRVTQRSLRWAAACGYPVHVHWDEAGFLGDELPSEKYPNALLLKRALENIAPGDILLMHLGVWSRKDPLAPILKPLIQGLKARGLCFGTLEASKRAERRLDRTGARTEADGATARELRRVARWSTHYLIAMPFAGRSEAAGTWDGRTGL
jgi:peptidoglycan/xylan/chitin deacetylase (PgdA/CDA1 family)